MSIKRWLFLPFLGGADKREERHHESGRDRRNFHGDNGMVVKHESAADFANKGEEELVRDYNAPITWYCLATLFPLIAGTFGPMASAFNICAVAIDWRLIVDASSDESEGQHIADPTWLVAVNAVSLAIAIIANFALLLNMTGRIRFNTGAPIVIMGWYTAGFIDIALVAAAPTHLPLPADPMATYSQAYYYAIFSGAIYVLLSMMMSVTAWGVWVGSYSSEFKLSLAQRSLMLQTMLFLGYILAAGEVFSVIEGWVYLDGVYYVVVTLFTIGFGDLTPKTHLGRSLYFPMAIGGIIFVGLIIANIRTLVVESVSVKVSTRMIEKARYKAIKSGDPANGIVKIRAVRRRSTSGPTELERREKEFYIMREIQKSAGHDNRIFALLFATLAFMILWFVGAVCFWQAEKSVGGQNWSYFEALYFTYTAQITIGYGDFEPQSNSAKPTFVFWALIALPTLTVLIGAVGDAVTDFVNWATLWLGKHAPSLIKLVTGMHKNANRDETFKVAVERVGAEIEGPRAASSGFEGIADVESGKIVPSGLSNNTFGELALHVADEAYRPFLMTQVSQKVLEHLDEETPRKYTYQEWTFLLRLLGEDEASDVNHRKVGQTLPDHAEVASPVLQHKHQVWSWMGQESPLMSLEDDSEPKWVLKRLMQVLEKELRRRGDHHVAKQNEKAEGSLPG
ncbi:hypothetical protein LTR36_006417 [Oleoguttula mirabilis]|uniref:Potassium channel domain-containing protein n=1 Tax=Oleoguttula mirabilis TaxID=1507867 RepID=A0AAV9JUM2_9PEZI|nr:hypothetical protein LTR36_006417 [Oleoguttula mirabilis]